MTDAATATFFAVGEAVADGLEPLREKYEYFMNNKDYLQKVYTDSAQKAAYLASKMLSKVQKKDRLYQKNKLKKETF